MSEKNCSQLNNKLVSLVQDLQRTSSRDLADVRDVVLMVYFLRFLSSNHEYINIPPEYNFELLCSCQEKSLSQYIAYLANEIEAINSNVLSGLSQAVEHLLRTSSTDPQWEGFIYALCRGLRELDFESCLSDDPNIFQKSFLSLVAFFSDSSGKKAGEFYSPSAVGDLMIELLEPKEGMSIYDPVCGSGGFLAKAARYIEMHGESPHFCRFVGQELNVSTLLIAKLNLAIHGLTNIELYLGDVITNPGNLDSNENLERFDVVVADPPFSMKSWIRDGFDLQQYDRFELGVPPKNNADYAFILHALSCLKEGGKAALVVSDGVLFRRGSEGVIREGLIKCGYVDAVISLPPKLFVGTGITTNILILSKSRAREDILFIKLDKHYESSNSRNVLAQDYIVSVEKAYRDRESNGTDSYCANFEEIALNSFDLRASRYVKQKREGYVADEIPISEAISKQNRLGKELVQLQDEIRELLSRIV